MTDTSAVSASVDLDIAGLLLHMRSLRPNGPIANSILLNTKWRTAFEQLPVQSGAAPLCSIDVYFHERANESEIVCGSRQQVTEYVRYLDALEATHED